MSTIGAHIRNGRLARLLRSGLVGQTGDGAEASAANTPHWLLWSAGAIAFVLGIVAFLLWGLNGASMLFDMILAFCT
jgi:hypothetical protein